MVLLHHHIYTFPTVAVMDGIFFAGKRAPMLHADVPFEIILLADGNHIAHPDDLKADDLLIFPKFGDGFDGVVDDVPEEGIDILLCHEIEQTAVGDAGESNALFCAEKGLFAQDYVKGAIAGFDG